MFNCVCVCVSIGANWTAADPDGIVHQLHHRLAAEPVGGTVGQRLCRLQHE